MPKLIDLEKIKPTDFPSTEMDGLDVVRYLNTLPTVDAIPVDEIRVDFERLCLENQEAILNISICGKPNEVKLPFSKEVAEVVHGRWRKYDDDKFCGYDKDGRIKYRKVYTFYCSNCGRATAVKSNHCPKCGAKMDGDGNG